MSSEVLVRLMVERPDESAAAEDAALLSEALRPFGTPGAPHLERYWKIEEYFDLLVALSVENAEATLLHVARLLADRWEWGRYRQWAVWDVRLHGAFRIERLAPSARWAHLDILDRGNP
jgi:hypothetical protein